MSPATREPKPGECWRHKTGKHVRVLLLDDEWAWGTAEGESWASCIHLSAIAANYEPCAEHPPLTEEAPL